MTGYLTASLLDGVPHAFSTRAGLEAGAVLPGVAPVLLRQVHSAQVVTVAAPFDGDPPEGDALVTDRPGVLIGIVTADCAPVLFADRQAGVIGAAHAGWRGALAGVIGNTVEAMERLGARREDVCAVIGPTIAQASYEVDASLRDRFVADDQANVRFFADGAPGHFQFDLPAYVAARLADAGVDRHDDIGCDTYTEPLRFCSFRRATHRDEPTGGRQTSVIGLPA